MPQPFPHRVSLLATSLIVPISVEPAIVVSARLIGCLVFDHLVRHPVVSVSDFDDDRLVDDTGRLLDANHPEAEDMIDWQFRVNRRADVAWLEVVLDATRDAAVRLHARRPLGPVETWTAADRRGRLSVQLTDVLDQWLAARHLPPAGALAAFTRDELLATIALVDRGPLPDGTAPPPGLAVAFHRVIGEPISDAGRTWPRVLALDPDHVVARRTAYLASLRDRDADRRAILDVVGIAPMYGKAHLSIWGEAFAADRPVEGMGLHHQGIAAMLLPSNPYACHNYSLQLAEKGRREESYRWADRATVAAPEFASAHLDCVRRLRRLGMPGQAFVEAQYRCGEILDHHRRGLLAPHERSHAHHAELLLAFVHFDIGRIDEAIELAESALASAPRGLDAELGWARARLDQWRTDPALLGGAFAWDGHHGGDPGRVIKGLALGQITSDEEVAMLIEALVALGREELAVLAFHHFLGVDGGALLGDGKARLAGAKALLLCGDASAALEQIQIVQLRRPQARLEAEINRVLRLACCRSALEWDAAIRALIAAGAARLARRAARDLADFVPDLSPAVVAAAVGEPTGFVLDAAAIDAMVGAVPEAARLSRSIVARLARPPDDSLDAADQLAQEWWSVLVPPAEDRGGHAASAVLALGISVARYLELSTQPPTPIAGAYRHIATEALQLVRRARYQITDRAIRGLLVLFDRCGAAAEWLRDTWLLRIERALDLDHEHGAMLAALTQGLPGVTSLLRGDERTGWELRFAFDLAADPDQLEPASVMLERALRATEGGSVAAAWGRLLGTAPAATATAAVIDALWLAALAAQHWEPWAHLAAALFASDRADDGFEVALRAVGRATNADRPRVIERLLRVWPEAVQLDVPLAPAAAAKRGVAALGSPVTLDRAMRNLRWAAAADPTNAAIVRALGGAYARAGRAHDAVSVFASIDRVDPARLAGNALLDARRFADAVLAYRYAALRFTRAEDWRLLAVAAWHANDNEVAMYAFQRCMAAGGTIDAETLTGYVTALNSVGRWKEAEAVAERLLDTAREPVYRAAGLHALAVALAGQGNFTEAGRIAREAVAENPAQDTEELRETLRCIEARQGPPVEAGPESSIERVAFDALAAGDRHAPEHLARDANSWGLARAALAAAALRDPDDESAAQPGRALEAAVGILGRTIGVCAPDAILCRIRALRIREDGFIQIDPAPPPGRRLTVEALEERHAERVERSRARRAGAALARPRTTAPPDTADPAGPDTPPQ